MLTRSGLGDDSRFSHPVSEESLSDGVVDLVRTGVGQIFPFEQHSDTEELGEPSCLLERGRAADEVGQPAPELGHELRIVPGGLELFGQLGQRRHQRFGSESSPEVTKAPFGVGPSETPGEAHDPLAAETKASIRRGFLIPGRSSTPPATSTPNGRQRAITAPTVSGVSLPATTNRRSVRGSRS